MQINNYLFEKTCDACPEQYEVYDENGKHVAYVRLRWGYLYAVCPDVGGDMVYEYEFEGDQGCFVNNVERAIHLNRIANAIEIFYREN